MPAAAGELPVAHMNHDAQGEAGASSCAAAWPTHSTVAVAWPGPARGFSREPPAGWLGLTQDWAGSTEGPPTNLRWLAASGALAPWHRHCPQQDPPHSSALPWASQVLLHCTDPHVSLGWLGAQCPSLSRGGSSRKATVLRFHS